VLAQVAYDSAREEPPVAPPPRELGGAPTVALSAAPEPGAIAVAPPGAADPAGPLSPHQILIDLGPPRSEVFVDGRRVGHTPFVGQVMCRPGREFSIHVVPERGFPIEEQRVCPR